MKNSIIYTRPFQRLKILFLFLLATIWTENLSAQCQLACNDEVNISLNGACSFVVTPEHLLEGQEECEEEILTVEITDQNGVNIGNMVTLDHRGLTLKARVISDSGNSCWSNILIEDKMGPPLICDTVYTTCSGSLIPGDSVARNVSYAAMVDEEDIPDDMEFEETYMLQVFGIDSAEILDINFLIDIEHEDLSDLVVTLTDPGGNSVTLINGDMDGSCNNGMMVTLDDDAMLTYADLQAMCDPDEERIGRYQASGSLDGLIGMDYDPKGFWEVRVEDTDGGSGGGTINKLVLVLEQEGAIVRFPGRGDITGEQISQNTFRLEGLDPCGDVIATYTDQVEEQDCDNPIDKIIRRTWNAVDEDGNEAIPCEQLIYVYRNDLSTLVLPPNFDGVQNPVLSCVDFGDMVPDSTVTGYPMGEFCDKVQIFPIVDKRIDVCPGSYKLLREFTILEWCTEEIINYTQLIKVVDTIGPEILGIEDITLSADPWQCIGNITLPKPEARDACSDSFDYAIGYQIPDVFGDFDIEGRPFSSVNAVMDGDNFIITDLPLGEVLIRWSVTDQCDQRTDSIFTLTIRDEIPPTAVCDEFTVVGIGKDGIAKVPAFVFDDLSHDNCEIISYQARKMWDSCYIDGTTLFRDTITFCCAEIGTSITVEFRVEDSSGNFNTCMVEVKVEDKLPPFIKRCPPDIELDCSEDFTDLDITGNLIEGIDVIDNCGPLDITFTDDENVDNCGVGVVRRRWKVTDGVGLMHTCTQIITLVDQDPFDEDDIIRPLDLDTMDCDANLHPDSLGDQYRLSTNGDHCNMVAISYKDQEFLIIEDACEKIIRTWAIIDWCRYRPDSDLGVFEYTQILKKSNDIAPEIKNCRDTILSATNPDCTGDINYTLDAMDDCTPVDKLQGYWEVDFDSDNDIDDNGNGLTINERWPVGKHLVSWHVEDGCGNISKCKQEIYVKDLKNPTPYCLTSITTVVMNNNGRIEIWARDHDYGSFDNCTPQDRLWFTLNQEFPVLDSINEPHFFKGTGMSATRAEWEAGDAQRWDPRQRTSGLILDCDDIPNGKESRIGLEMTVWDEYFNYDYCTVELILQDNEGDACEDRDVEEMFEVSGSIMSRDQAMLGGIEVTLTSGELREMTTTDSRGSYAFTDLEGLKNYLITASKNNDHLNGVNTLDLVKIQRHLLGLKTFDSPYQILASDADNNSKITASDVLVLRKLILGIYDEFIDGQESWRFISEDLQMADPQDPFPIIDGIHISDLNRNHSSRNLMGLKIGDVDGDVNPKLREGNINTRSHEQMVLQMPAVNAKYGERIEVPIYARDRIDILGMQFSLDYDPGMLKFSHIEGVGLNITDDHVGERFEGDGLLTISWNEINAIPISQGAHLFTLYYESLEDHKVQLNINSAITEAQAYNGDESRMDINLIEEGIDAEIVLEQNMPNPFSELTRVNFTLPEAMEVALEVNDAAGRLIYKRTKYFNSGRNSLEIRSDELDAKGVLYYSLKAGGKILTKKMIKF